MFCKFYALNRLSPSYPLPLFQNESTCETIHMKMCSTFMSISCKSNSFSFEWVRTKTRFETEANSNSEMAYSFIAIRIMICAIPQHLYFIFKHTTYSTVSNKRIIGPGGGGGGLPYEMDGDARRLA